MGGGACRISLCRVASRNLHSRLLMEKMLVKKRRVVLRQECKEVRIDWSLIEKYLVGSNMNGKEEEEKTSNLQTQPQVGTSSSIRLILFDTILPLDPSLLSPSTFLIHNPKQSPTSWNLFVHCSVYVQIFQDVRLLWDTELLASVPCCSAWSCNTIRVTDE